MPQKLSDELYLRTNGISAMSANLSAQRTGETKISFTFKEKPIYLNYGIYEYMMNKNRVDLHLKVNINDAVAKVGRQFRYDKWATVPYYVSVDLPKHAFKIMDLPVYSKIKY